jgi:uncharacterized protein (DUF1501 family)
MPTRRTFLKQSAGLVAAGVILPSTLVSRAQAQSAERKILVVIQLQGGSDGLNMVVPYTDSLYHSYRPNLHFTESELRDDAGNSTVVSSRFGLHPALKEIKSLYDSGRVAIIQGVGYPNPNLSHFTSMDIWHTANPNGGSGLGWLGRYADIKLAGEKGLPAAGVGGVPVKSLFAEKVVIPSISNFDAFQFVTDAQFPSDRQNQVSLFNTTYGRSFPSESFMAAIAGTGVGAVAGADQVQGAIADYSSPVTYPEGNPLAAGMKMLAQIIITIPEASLLYVQMGGFDHHSQQIAFENNQPNKLAGQHHQLLGYFSQAVKAFYDDMAAHNLADRVLMIEWSEFGRRPRENASLGTDHGTVEPLFIIGDRVRGGIKGEMPSLSDLDQAGNMKFTLDFRSVYAEALDKWLDVDSRAVLGSQFEHAGFL